MKKFSIVLALLLLISIASKAQTHVQNQKLTKAQIQKIIKQIRAGYYEAKKNMAQAKENEEAPIRVINFSLDASPDIPAIGNFNVQLEYDVLNNFVTGHVTRAASEEYYEFFYMPWGLAFAYEKDDYDGTQKRIYFYKGKIIKQYSTDADGNISNSDVELGLDYTEINRLVKAFKDYYNATIVPMENEDED